MITLPVVTGVAVVLLVEPVLVVRVGNSEANSAVEVLKMLNIREHPTATPAKRLVIATCENGPHSRGSALASTYM